MLVMREANLNINTKITNFFMSKNKQKNKLKKIKKMLDKQKTAQYNSKCPQERNKTKYIEK